MRSTSANSAARTRAMTTPSQAAGAAGGRCRDWTGAAYAPIRSGGRYGQGTVQTTNASGETPSNEAAAKAEVVRKSAAREGIRVRASVIPCTPGGHGCDDVGVRADRTMIADWLRSLRRTEHRQSSTARRLRYRADHRLGEAVPRVVLSRLVFLALGRV